MTTRPIILLTLVLSAFVGCNSRPPEDSQSAQSDTTSSTETSPFDSALGRPFDTVAVTKALALTHADTIELHLLSSRESADLYSTDELSVQKVTDLLPPFYFRFLAAATGQDSDGVKQVAYLLIYAPVNDLSKVKRIGKGAISIEEGGGEGFHPQFLVTDINGDGVNDLIVSLQEDGRYDLIDCNFFHHYDTLSASLVADTALDAQFGRQTITFDEQEKEISTGYITGNGQYEFEVYRWDGKGYPLFAKTRGEIDDTGEYMIETREELRDGKWTVVKIDSMSPIR
jgi:hypothetical protein